MERLDSPDGPRVVWRVLVLPRGMVYDRLSGVWRMAAHEVRRLERAPHGVSRRPHARRRAHGQPRPIPDDVLMGFEHVRTHAARVVCPRCRVTQVLDPARLRYVDEPRVE
jgi:hypothetical protein